MKHKNHIFRKRENNVKWLGRQLCYVKRIEFSTLFRLAFYNQFLRIFSGRWMWRLALVLQGWCKSLHSGWGAGLIQESIRKILVAHGADCSFLTHLCPLRSRREEHGLTILRTSLLNAKILQFLRPLHRFCVILMRSMLLNFLLPKA